MPFGMRRPQGQPPQGQPPQGYGAPQGAPQGYGQRGPLREKGPSGGGRAVPLRVEKINDKSLQSRLIYGNLYVLHLGMPWRARRLTTLQVRRSTRRLPPEPGWFRLVHPPQSCRWRRIRRNCEAHTRISARVHQLVRSPAFMVRRCYDRQLHRRAVRPICTV